MTLRKARAVLVLALSWSVIGCGGDEGGGATLTSRLVQVQPVGGSGGSFATRMAIDGDRLAVGSSDATPAAVHLYVRRGQGWAEDGMVEGTDVDFGRNLALRGNLLAVGLPWAGAAGRGQVAIFERRGDGWRHEATLEGPAGTAGGLGQGVAFDGDRLFAGAPGGPEAGEVLVFARGRRWHLEARVAPRVRAEFDGFGAALAAEEGVLAVGGWFPGTAVTVFQAGARGGNGWREVATLTEPGAEPDGQFGTRLALKGGVLAVSCTCPDGEVWVYGRAGHRWSVQAELRAPWTTTDVGMAHDVALSRGGRQLVVTAPYLGADGLTDVGVALVFERGPGGWALAQTLRPPAPEAALGFGHAVGLDHGLVVVGAPGAGGGAGEVVTFSLAGP